MTVKIVYLIGILVAVSYAAALSDSDNAILNIDPNTQCPRRQKENKNKQIVWDAMCEFYGEKNVDVADKIIGEKYIQHNPHIADGKEAVKEAARGWFKGMGKEKVDIKRIAADGDLVWVHRKSVCADGIAKAIVDIFRLENEKLVEHWDVIQPIPEKSANDHPMF